MSLQEVFTTVKNHLLTQNAKSGVPDLFIPSGFSCKYRDPEGRKCAAGVLIPDSEYNPDWEGRLSHVVPYILNNFTPEERALIYKLQKVHDNNPVENWPTRLQELAENFELIY